MTGLTPAQKDDIARGRQDCINGKKQREFQSRFYNYGYWVQQTIQKQRVNNE